MPIHTLLITGPGLNLLDNQDLEAVAVVAAKHNRWVFSIAPLAVTGGTGSPANIIATFESFDATSAERSEAGI